MSVATVPIKLADVAELNPRLPVALDDNELVSFLPMAAVTAETARTTLGEERNYRDVRKGYTPFLRGDVLLAKITPCFENGKIAQATIAHEVGFGSTEFHVVRPHADKADARYLMHFLRQPDIRLDGERKMTGSGGQRRVPAHFLAGLQMQLPQLPEQRRIAEVLDRADALRTKRRAALAQLDSLTQSLFLDMFGNPASELLAFPLATLASVLARPLQNGAYFPKEMYAAVGGVEMVHMGDAFGGVIKRGSLKRAQCAISDQEKYGLSSADILLARRSLTYEGAAKPCLIPPSEEPLIFESSFIRVTPEAATISCSYLFHYLNNDIVRRRFVRPFVTQSTISGINQSNLEQVQIILPPLALQEDFARRIIAVDKLKTSHRVALTELDALFASLQHRAFRGEL